MFIKAISLLNIYFFLNGIFKRVKFDKGITDLSNTEKYDSVIYIVFDALRYDYILKDLHTPSHYLHNNMPKYASIKNKYEALSICAIPTSTTCRIIGLLTGTPSNFLEGSKTFLNSTLDIDNMVNQMYKKYKGSVSFFGDSTWLSLCPILNDCTNFVIDPYSKKNLIENEKKAISALINRIGIDKAILCHLISLDSMGHTYRTTNHVYLKEALNRFDDMIYDVYNKMSDRTLLVLTSDHGVTDEGEHGGVSSHEMSSFVSFISKTPLRLFNVSKNVQKLRKEFVGKRYDLDNEYYAKRVDVNKTNIVHQDDILPTLSYLLGLGVPKNSYGNVIHELFDDPVFLHSFLLQKCAMIKRDPLSFQNIYNLYDAHYSLSRDIYEEFSGRNTVCLVISIILTLLLCCHIFYKSFILIKNYFSRQKGLKSDILRIVLVVFAIIMVSHSVGAIKNERYVWMITFLLCNTSKRNILPAILFFLHDRSGIMSNVLFYTCLCLILVQYKITHIKLYWLLALSTIKDHYPSIIMNSSREIIGLYPECQVMALLVYNAKFNMFLLILPYLDINSYCIFPLLNLLGGVKELEKIDYSITYVFTDTPNFLESGIPSLFYFVYSRLLVKKNRWSFIISLFNLLCVFAVTFYEFDSMSFYFYFASRCFFVCLFFVVDLFLIKL